MIFVTNKSICSNKASRLYLQPVTYTVWAVLSIDVKVVGEVESNSESGLNSDDVLAGQKWR